MLVGRKYILNENSGIIFDLEQYPEIRMQPDDAYMDNEGYGIGMLVHLSDVDIDPVLIFNDKQAKELEKALKIYRRKLRKKRRRLF